MAERDAPYAIGDLATLAGVSRRTVRYYVQEGLIPSPAGLGRGNHYGAAHLEALLRVKAMQEQGRTLDDIRRTLHSRDSRPAAAHVAAYHPVSASGSAPGNTPAETTGPIRPALVRSLWRRLAMASGVELHVDSTLDLPSPAALRELEDWCRRHLAPPRHPHEKD